jgi:4-hydroxy-2-oxoheptanedioate aldolase
VSSPSLRTRLREGEALAGLFANLGSPLSAELCAAAGLDWVLVDLEHGSGSEAGLMHELQGIAAAGSRGLVRVESHDRARIGRALDAGAAGVMVPRVDTAGEAEMVVRALEYPPRGTRGVAFTHRGGRFGVALASVRAGEPPEVLTIVQVESPLAVENVEEIAAVEGVDVIFLGPADLTASLGILGELADPRYTASRDALLEASRRHGKAAGIFLAGLDTLDEHLAAGFRFLALGSDGALLGAGVRSALETFERARKRLP